MKDLNWIDKILFSLNILAAVALLFSYLLPYIPPSTFALLSVLTLAVPFLIMVNFIFFLFWLLRVRKQVFLSLFVLLLGINYVASIYEVSTSEDIPGHDNVLKVLSYNVRQFDQFGWSDIPNIPKKISRFVKGQDPDIISMQEYYAGELAVASSFPYKYIKKKVENAEFGLAILSKYPIIDSGSLDFPTTSNNNAIYADIVVEDDTLRIINVHLQSFSVKPDFGNLEDQNKKKLLFGMGKTFVRQERQMEIILDLVRETPAGYEIIIMGDFNNTAYSYIYREIKSEGFYDAYKEAGNGLGNTFNLKFIPLQIDFILARESLEVLGFETYNVPFSDHFPITATFDLD